MSFFSNFVKGVFIPRLTLTQTSVVHLFFNLLINLLIYKYWLNIYYVSVTILRTEDTKLCKTDEVPALVTFHFCSNHPHLALIDL